MSKIEELIKERYETNYQANKERYISMCIIQTYYREHEYDKSILDTFGYRDKLVDIICLDHRWEPFYNGFLTRTDFKYDERRDEITFTTHRIIKEGDQYISDGSEISNNHFNNHADAFTSIAKVDDLINRYYLKDKAKFDQFIEETPYYKKTDSSIIRERIINEREQDELFLKTYGTIGIELLIKWLNKLNDPETSIEDLITEFKSDMATAKLYFETHGVHNYPRGHSNIYDIETLLLKILEKYSPRGVYLRLYNYRKLDNQDKKTLLS